MAGRQYPLDIVIKAVDKASAPLRLLQQRINATMQGTGATTVANRWGALVNASGWAQVSQRFGQVYDAVGKVDRAIGTTFRRASVVGGAVAGAGYLFGREFIGTADTFERLQLSLEAIEGSAPKAAQAMAFIKQLALKTPFETEEIAKSYRTLVGFGMDPKNGVLKAITDQTAKLGGTGEDLTGIALQLGQAFSKGRLQAQDANILVERGVPVWGLLQRAVERVNKGQKVSIAQLRQMSEQGQIGIKGINMLIEQMGLESTGASDKMMRTWTGIISNIRDQWTFFKLDLMDRGPYQVLKDEAQAVLDKLTDMARSGELRAWSEYFGKKLTGAFEWLRQNGPAIWAQVRSDLRSAYGYAQTFADAVGGWGNIIKIGLATYIGGPLIASLAQLGIALAGLNLSLAGTPVGLLLLGGAAVIGGAYAFTNYQVAKAQRMQQGPPRREFLTGPLSNATPDAASAVAAANALRLSPTQLQSLQGAIANPSASTAKVQIDINNLPAGSRAKIDPSSTASVDLSAGYAFAGAH